MDDLIKFLRARLDEDAAEIAKHPDDDLYDPDRFVAAEETNYPCYPYLQVGKRYALADVAFKRDLVDECERAFADGWADDYRLGERDFANFVLHQVALLYASHPEFRAEWRPGVGADPGE